MRGMVEELIQQEAQHYLLHMGKVLQCGISYACVFLLKDMHMAVKDSGEVTTTLIQICGGVCFYCSLECYHINRVVH